MDAFKQRANTKHWYLPNGNLVKSYTEASSYVLVKIDITIYTKRRVDIANSCTNITEMKMQKREVCRKEAVLTIMD